jgi:polyhydroxybutyrate depolymerase
LKTTCWIILSLVFIIVLLGGIFYLSNRTNGQIQSGGQTRRYLLYVPESYQPDSPNPLVISIHGFVQWPAHQQGLSGWNQLADEHGFLVVYPRGTGFPLRWNTGPVSEDPEGSQQEVEFFLDLIEHLSQTYSIDQDRIYANGMSNGGGMTHLLACQLSERIAAFGGVAGAYFYPEEYCQPLNPTPWIAFHGVDDPIVPYQGGPSQGRHADIQFPAIETWMRRWADQNSCDPDPETVEITPGITRFSYSGCDQDVEVTLYRIAGAGHTWPGGGKLPVWLTGTTNQDIDATALMWEFYQQYSLQE